jgi:cytochrome c-type biogenesis protein CcmH/NrfG
VSDDANQQLLAEIRSLRRTNQVAWVATILLLGVFVYLTVHFHKSEPAWETVHTLADSLQYDKALATAKELFEKDPNNPYGYAYVGNVQVAAGRIKEAEDSYARAYELFPTEFNASQLRAIRKRRENLDSSQSSTPQP